MSACYCDWEDRPSMYVAERRTARKPHRCAECGRQITPGEVYEHVRAVVARDPVTADTCPHCLALRDWVTAHVPCSCWSHHDMIEDMRAEVEHYGQQAPGLTMGYLRRLVSIRRAAGFTRVPGRGYIRRTAA